MLHLSRPLFWLKYCTKDLHQTFKTCSSISSQTGCPHDPLSGRLSHPGVNLPGGTESHSYGCIPPGKRRLHCQSGKVLFDSDPNNNIPGLCNRLHCRSTKPPTGESCKGEIPLLKDKGISNYTCSSNSKCTWYSRVVSPSNLASTPSFSILANQNDPSSTFEQRELRCAYYSGSQLLGRTSLVGVQHHLCERQLNKTSSSNIVYNNRCIQDRMGRSLRKSTHKRALVRQRTHPAHKCIGAQGCLPGPKVLSKGGMPENGQHNSCSPCEQRGGTHSPCLLALTLELWQWCLERNIMISAQHVPGKLNTIADSESRVFNDSSEWKIDPQTISPFLKGCEIDLFASRLSAQLPQYVSWRLDPEAVHADALTMDWAPFKGYAFPPFNLIPAVLHKVSQDKADIILVAPIWPAQPWWPLLLSLLIEHPVLLPRSRHLLRDPTDPQRINPMFPRLHLAVFHVSGDSTRQWAFQTVLRRFSFRLPANLRGKHINQRGDAGVAGVLRERLILFQHL